MAIAVGSRVGPYEVVAPLGQGGMGVVFRARDARLNRDVALKLLPDHFAKDPERLARFEREAQLLASLNHPNIAQVYGLEQAGSSSCIVMELVDGETLAEWVGRVGQNGHDGRTIEALAIGRQIADALEAAHERGIVHRDLKPANVKLTPDGKVKVLDFGLAKGGAAGATGALGDISNSPTIMSASIPGVVLGTLAYMSPEQARGKPVDARTDIWAFGCVLYEMLTGRRAFDGETATDIVARIVTAGPDWDRLPPDTPSSIRLLLAATLNKDPRKRLQHIGDSRLFLDSAVVPQLPITAVPGRRARWAWLVPAGLVAALLAALVPAVSYFRQVPPQASPIAFEMSSPGFSCCLSISPNGKTVAYVASDGGGPGIWVRPLGVIAAQKLTGTENAGGLFWSPDSRYLAFSADQKLKKIEASGGPVQVLGDSPVHAPGTWNREGQILFTGRASGSQTFGAITRIPASGGDAQAATISVPTNTEPLSLHYAPQFLPDGRHFLYQKAGTELRVGALDSTESTRVGPVDVARQPGPNFLLESAVVYAEPGFLLFTRNATLMAQRFDLKRLALVGEPATVVEGVQNFAVSENGALVYRKGAVQPQAAPPLFQLSWFDRRGAQAGRVGGPSSYSSPRLAPDGRRVAADTEESGNRDVWILDVLTQSQTRLTFDPAADSTPIWAPDGNRITFASNRGFVPNRGSGVFSFKLFQKSANGVGADELLTAGDADEVIFPEDWSSDGRYITIHRFKLTAVSSVIDLWALPLFGDKKPFPLVQSASRKLQSQLSPDGRWIAYTTNESGTYQVVVQPFPDTTKGKWQVSARGGVEPRWRRDGREIFFLALDGKIMAVPVNGVTAFEGGQPSALFQTALVVPPLPNVFHYDVTADGQRFLINSPVAISPSEGSGSSIPITAVVNWTSALKIQ